MLEEEREEDFSKRTRAINNLQCIQRDNEYSSKLKLKEQEKEVELLEKIKIIDQQTQNKLELLKKREIQISNAKQEQ